MTEYIIINKTAILKRIEELKKPFAHYDGIYVSDKQVAEFQALQKILSQSTPLIPELDKAYETGKLDAELGQTFDNPKGRYLNNINLNI